MKEDKTQGYLYTILMGVLTAFLCFAIADGIFGIEGSIQNYEEYENGYHTFTLFIDDPTGKYIFWASLIGLPVLFSKHVSVRHTWVNLPIFLVTWYLFSAAFGESPSHRYLAHPSGGWIEIGDGLEPFGVMFLLWTIQAIVLFVLFLLRLIWGKIMKEERSE